MRNFTLYFNKFMIVLLLLIIHNGYAIPSSIEYREYNSNWLQKSFAPGLFLQPYYAFENNESINVAAAGSSLFSDDFEGATTNWTFINSVQNGWFIGTATKNGGTKSMYVSDDKGISNSYSLTTSVSFAVSKAISIPVSTSDVSLTYDWKGEGEGTASYLYDYLEVWIVDESFTPTAGTKMNTTKGKLLKGPSLKQATWKTEFLVTDVSIYAGKKIKIVFQWANDFNSFYPPAAAIDNVEIETISCSSPKDMKAGAINTDSADVTWVGPNGYLDNNYELFINTTDNSPSGSSTIISVNNALTYSFKGLVPNQSYFVWYRTVCSPTDKSYWTGPYQFRTPCVLLNLPFLEGFDTTSSTIYCWTIIDNNKDETTSNNIWRTSTSFKDGTHSMYFYGNSTSPKHDDWLISPTFKVDSTKTYRLKYHYKTSTSYKNDFEVKLSNSGVGVSDFTTTLISKKGHSSSDWDEERYFMTGIEGEINIAWLVNTVKSGTYLYLDNISLEEVNCTEAFDLSSKDIKSDRATIIWQDNKNSSWEYSIQEKDDGEPISAGTPTTVKEVIVDKKQDGTPLSDNTEYEYYVRAKCANGGFSDWIGPFVFRTTCKALITPFTETFETNSPTLDCWNILDNNGDGISSGTNKWRLYNSTYAANQGSYSMYFYGTSTSTNHDDWLVSPTVQMNSSFVYRLTYYFKTSSSTTYNIEFEVVLSTDGIDTKKFTTVLEPKTVYKTDNYEKRTVYITGITGDANIAWHVMSKGTTYVYIDDVSIEKMDCIGPEDDVITKEVKKDEATFTWEDDKNSQWEYYVQEAGGTLPVGSGSLANKKEITVKKHNDLGGGNLKPNTEYEFYLRSTCGPGKTSGWIGPITFRTLCDEFNLPFWEGFNTDSETLSCWTIVDGNNDATESATSSNRWRAYQTTGSYEGDQSMYYYGSQSDVTKKPHNDWLISPTFNFDATKIYRIRYHYKTSTSSSDTYEYEHEVMLSKAGIDLDKFTTTVVARKKYAPGSNYIEKKEFISGVGGKVNIGWHVTSNANYTTLYVDNVFVEEVSCPEPIDLDVKDEKETEATIFWKDNFGSDWEYYVVKAGGAVPTGNGTPTKNKEVKITQDSNGNVLTHTTVYEYYVRTICSLEEQSEWSGPYLFKTACGVFDTPFWEGFNTGSVTLDCWSVIDENADAGMSTTSNIWTTSTTRFEGSHSAHFYGSQKEEDKRPHNDWLMTPRIKFEAGKKYRLKYNYRTTSTTSYDYEFAVLMSTTGTNSTANYTQVIVPKKKYDPSTEWKEEYLFIDGVNADVSLAWQVTSSSQYTYLYIDNVSIEEVTGCPEPLPTSMGVKDIEAKKVTLFWDDAFGATAWEYYIQEAGKASPIGSGTASTTKETIVTIDGKGNPFTPNTEYEFYVRTNCGNGTYSIWQGPIKFITGCDIYTIPYYENFDKLEKTYRCWTIIDGNADATSPTGNNIWRTYDIASGVYEGDQAMYFYGTTGQTHDDWLVSPTIKMDPGMYVLKYHYRSSASYNNEFEVLMSSQGIDTTKFTTTVLPTKVYKNGNYEEEVTFFNGVSGDINLAWHVKSVGTTYVYLDKITLKKVDTCPEPYYVKITGQTATTIDLEWQQDGGITSWEVLVVDYGQDETATPIQTTTVTGTPKTTLTGFTGGKAYTIFVRAKCTDGKSNSDWSTKVIFGTKVDGNDICSGAFTIPVNDGKECLETVSGSFIKMANEKTIDSPSCNTFLKKDVWFEFTANRDTHALKILDWINLSGTTVTTIYGAIYDQPCTSITNTALECFTLSSTSNFKAFKNLISGQKYYIRLGINDNVYTPDIDHIFNLCITSPDYLYVSPHGEDYTAEELVKDVFVKSNCDLVSNVTYQVGDGSPATTSINTLGYFNQNNTEFPFKEGIVLSTSEVKFVSGPFNGAYADRGKNPYRWTGDKDINDAINAAGGGPTESKRVTQLEFDFIPIKDSIKFEYLFTSNSYVKGCTYDCGVGALFAAWLIDTTTGEGINLAKIKGTDIPIALNTIRDADKSGVTCGSVNPEYYWKHYENGIDEPSESPIDFVGMTKAMESDKYYVVPGRKYHIKLAVMDFCTTQSHSSAVFFNAGSFDLGDLDLGADLLVENGNALCGGECVTIKSGLGEENVNITWYKDGEVIPGATEPNYEACESGVYKVVGEYPEINCSVIGEKIIEIFPPISVVVKKPNHIDLCLNSLVPIVLNLDDQEDEMFINVNREDYKTTYYLDLAEAEQGSDNFIDPKYAYDTDQGGISIFIRIDDLRTDCFEIFELIIKVSKGEVPNKPEDVVICASYTLPTLEENQYYYTESAAKGVEYKAGDVLDVPGEHTIYILQRNGDEGCYEEVFFNVSITGDVKADIFEDAVRDCILYVLNPLSENNSYYTKSGGPNGDGVRLIPGTVVGTTQTIYVYASSEDGLCVDESSFSIRYEDCPIQKGISPNGDGVNDQFDLSSHSVQDLKIYNRYGAEVYSYGFGYTNQWVGQDKNGNGLPDGTYYYVVLSHNKIRTGWVQINR
ncbi:choice-of-anchor J domain-containing protein [Myroides guanonis]|uniref:Cleaved Adhesin Domain n=1 Tax=Myroides guanonis TaxID=1150112 RepID=A0A1I3KUD4_9FLAO|nr:choice-of-anchor J domain-containing protein [Myroides guanonis]SFI76151.1 Cleaved Adhesin Domain [Myroides guanonis]